MAPFNAKKICVFECDVSIDNQKCSVCLCSLPININIQKLIEIYIKIGAKYNTKMFCEDIYYKYLSHAAVIWSG